MTVNGTATTPELILAKRLNIAASWFASNGTVMGYLDADESFTSVRNDQYVSSFTTTTIGLKNNAGINASGDELIMYCFASVSGYSRVSTYAGSGNSQTIYVTDDGTSSGSGGFQPSWIIIKNISANSSNWMMYDAVRDTDGTLNKFLEANTDDVEATASTATITPISNGFTIGNSNSLHINDSTDNYIYLAIK